MELSEHIKIIKKAKLFIISFILLVGALSFIVGYLKPVDYKAVASFDVNLINRSETTDYQYGSYYDLKGAEMFTQNVMSWLRTASVIEEIYKDAGVGYEIKNLDRFTNRFKTRQYAAQNFNVTFHDPSRDNAENIALSIGKVISQKVEASNRNLDNQSLFEIKPLTPIVVKNKLDLYIVTILGLIVGCVISIIFVYLRHYLQTAK